MHLFVVSVLTLPHSIAAEKIELIQLQNIIAEDIIPVIKPLLGSDAVITGKGYQLIARTTPSNLEKIKTIVKQIDVPQRILRITLREGKNSLEKGRSIAADSTITLSTDTSIVLGENSETHSDQLRIRTKKHTTKGRDDILYEVRTVENRATFLRLGKSVPYELHRLVTTGKHAGYGHSIGHKELSSGLFVVPRIRGDTVTLEFSSQRQQLARDDSGTIESSHLQSIVHGRLGDWITLGSIQSGRSIKDRSTTSRTIETGNDSLSLQVKVELLHR